MMNQEKVLPPGVSGKISGHLTVKVDEVFWTKNPLGEVFVELLWWGEKESSTFRPEDITFKENQKRKASSVTYTIRTSPGLFEAYLRNCGKLTFNVLRGQNKNVVIGTSVVKDLEHIISEKNYHSYFPIFSPKGVRIGDIHVCFDLIFKLKQSHFTIKHQEEINVAQTKHFRKPFSSKSSGSTSQDQLLSETLQKGQELRKAMVMSVLADCPIDKLDSVINSNASNSSEKLLPRRQEAKLVDFLLGKDMTPDEESKALEMLRCISPDENLLNIASSSSDPKVTKTSCCLHGKKCNKKRTKKLKPNSPPAVSDGPSVQPTSSSSDVQVIEDTLQGNKEEQNEMKKTVNCYELIVKTLNLTCEGARKIYYAPTLKDSEKPILNHNPPGTSFMLEIAFPSKSPWARTLKFTTKNYKEKCVNFDQGTTHKLCGTVTWARVKTQILGSVFTVYWRHLNQRVPCPLGSARLESLNLMSGADSVSLSLPVFSNTRLLTAHLNIYVKLGITSRSGGEAMFQLKENVKPPSSESQLISSNPQDTDLLSPYESAKSDNVISSEPSVIPLSSAFSDDSNEAEPGPSSLDDELVRTINLLNYKTESRPEANTLHVLKDRVDKQEACVQTTLPIENPECPSCGCSSNIKKPSQKKVSAADHDIKSPLPFVSKDRLDSKQKNPMDSGTRSVPSTDNRTEQKHCEKNCLLKEMPIQDFNIPENVNVAASELSGTEKIHEYTVKIVKVVGVPLFTGDYDLDCYIDYVFPKVDSNGKVVFDRVSMGTEIKIALRETEFGTVSRHRLRLRCKLTRALLRLPTNEITFYLWGRFYSPSPQDYRLGKATLPLAKLGALELKYEQERQPITEKFVLPISVLDSSLTSGYEGAFGEMHITITYSNASNLSYREWMCKNQDDHYWCRSRLIWGNDRYNPDFECPKALADVYSIPQNEAIISKNNDQFNNKAFMNTRFNYDSDKIIVDRRNICTEPYGLNRPINYNFVHEGKLEPHNYGMDPIMDKTFQKNNFLTSEIKTVPPIFRCKKGPGDRIVQSNLKGSIVENGFVVGLPRGTENLDMPARGRTDRIDGNRFLSNRRMQPIGGSNRCISPHSINNNFKSNYDNTGEINLGERENIVAKVLRDIKERKGHETHLVQNDNFDNEVEDIEENKDTFDSFDLRVDLPTREDTSDFEVNSQYSFLKTPPPVESTFHNGNCTDFDTDSSISIKQRVQQEQVVNPFSSHSHLSLSLNSDTSMFKKSPVKPVKSRAHLESSDKKSGAHVKDQLQKKHILDSIKSCSSPKKSRKKTIDGKKKKKCPLECESKNNNDVSSDETLKSVESLKSYREYPTERQSRDVAVGTEFDMENKDTQTSQKEKGYFKARVEICRALGLPSLEVKQNNGKIELVKPTSQAYFSAVVNGKETVLKTSIADKKTNPVWESSWEVCLPTDLLKKCDRELEIFVELNGDCDEAPIRTSDGSMHCPIVLRTGVDLTPMTAGLEHASGWFSLSDRALLSRAQIKVIVTPLEDISCFRDDWLKEYTKSKSRKLDICIPERSTSIATSLQEKLVELEKLTERMRRKMASRENWDQSPPLSLLDEVQKKSIDLSLENIITHTNARTGNRNKTAETATSPIIISHDVENISTVVVSDEDDKYSCGVVETYTICESSSDGDVEIESNHQDSLETPSETIDRVLNRVRKKSR